MNRRYCVVTQSTKYFPLKTVKDRDYLIFHRETPGTEPRALDSCQCRAIELSMLSVEHTRYSKSHQSHI